MADRFEEAVVARGHTGAEAGTEAMQVARVDAPLLTALLRAGTQHIYADTADVEELRGLSSAADGALPREVDGNTANQPLVRKVLERYLDSDEPRAWARELATLRSDWAPTNLAPVLYAIVCGRIGNEMAACFGAGRAWEGSLQLHMDLCADPARAHRVGRLLHRMVPSAFVKVPFTPDAPHCFLVARDLERVGIPVNFTSTFSARQAVAAALLADVSRTNVFMGRLNQALQADLLGEHVCLETQRELLVLRRDRDVQTRLIVASMREWQSFVDVAGCDVFTAPCGVIRDFLEQDEIDPEQIDGHLEESYEAALGVADAVAERLDPQRIARLYRVEPDLVEFLVELRGSSEYAGLADGDALYQRFDQAGFADLFHAPSSSERTQLERGKLPQLDGELVTRIPIDTHFSLLANADFARHQRDMDAMLEKCIRA